jgi:hypothetical protein
MIGLDSHLTLELEQAVKQLETDHWLYDDL